MWPRWKYFEKEVGTFFGGKRHIRINRAESTGDLDGVLSYSVECKYGKQVPGYLAVACPTELTVGDICYRLVPSKYAKVVDGTLTYDVLGWRTLARPNAKFLEDALEQAASYQTEQQLPLVCVKIPHEHGFNLIWEDYDGRCRDKN